MGKVSKNARVSGGNRATNQDSKNFIKLVISEKNPKTGGYSYKEVMVHKDNVQEFLKDVK